MTKKRYETFVNSISGKKVVIKCSKTMQVSKKEFDYFSIDQMGFEIDTYYEERLIEKDGFKGKIKLVAFGSDGFVREDTKWVSDIGLDDHVIFLPETNRVAETLRGLDLLVMPSLWEACGLLAMESLVVGTPVIGSNCDGLDEVLEGSPALKVHPKDVEELAEAMKYHYYNDRTTEFKNYAPIAADRFNVTHVVSKLKSLYDNVI